ncbi:adenine DNA glycosylase-like [Ciona intestinalis]
MSSYVFTQNEVEVLRKLLLSWYGSNKRDLPWRRMADSCTTLSQHAYAVWVSEVMLQQTRVATVVEYYNRWMKKWPDIQSLSNSTEEEVNELWSGLGYYSRGRRMREAAIKLVGEYDGKFPETSVDLLKTMPGVGRYTASAIASIAFKEVTGVVDGNVVRVLCRLRAIGGNTTHKTVISHLWGLANNIVDPASPGDFNQAMMELGATVCLPQNPKCSSCPVQSLCQAKAQVKEASMESKHDVLSNKSNSSETKEVKVKLENKMAAVVDIENCEDALALPVSEPWLFELGVTNYPRKPKKKEPREEKRAVVVIQLILTKNEIKTGDRGSVLDDSKWLLVQRPSEGLLAGLWDFPHKVLTETSDSEKKNSKKRKRIKPVSQHDNELKLFSDELISLFGQDNLEILNRNRIGDLVHIFSHIKQTNCVEHIQICYNDTNNITPQVNLPNQYKWMSSKEFNECGTSSAVRKIFTLCSKYEESKLGKKKKCKTDSVISDYFKKEV